MQSTGRVYAKRRFRCMRMALAAVVTCLACGAPAAAQSLRHLAASLNVARDLEADLRTVDAESSSVAASLDARASPVALRALLAAIERVRADLLLTSSESDRLRAALQAGGLPSIVGQRQQQAMTAFSEQSTRLATLLDGVTDASAAPVAPNVLRSALASLVAEIAREYPDENRTPLGVTLPVRSMA